VAGAGLVLLVPLTVRAAPVEHGGKGSREEAAHGLPLARPEGRPVPGVGSTEESSSDTAPAVVAPGMAVTVDSRRHTGYENATYAPTSSTVFVAYKRFLRNPYNPGGDYVPAQLRIARSEDGGRTWRIEVVDDGADEAGDVIDQSVSIGGDRQDAIYVAYLVQKGGSPDDMRLRVAKSTDGGHDWSIRTIARNGIGNYNAIRVIDRRTVLIAAVKSGNSEGIRLFSTENGGHDWSRSKVDNFGWYTGLDATQWGKIWVSYYNPGATSLHSATSLASNGPWMRDTVDGQGGDGDFTGLGASLDIARNGDVFIAYEDFQQSLGRSVVRVSTSDDGGASWARSRVEGAPIVGWNTAIRVLIGSDDEVSDAFVSYWLARGQPLRGHAKIAYSSDASPPWERFRIPEQRYVEPYLDMAVPNDSRQFVSYQARSSRGPILRVARIHVPE
jgi:hypothetical protein